MKPPHLKSVWQAELKVLREATDGATPFSHYYCLRCDARKMLGLHSWGLALNEGGRGERAKKWREGERGMKNEWYVLSLSSPDLASSQLLFLVLQM